MSVDRKCFSGSAALPDAVMLRLHDIASCQIYEGYGHAEAGLILAYNALGSGNKLRSVGRPLPNTQIQIVHLTSGEVLAPGNQIKAKSDQFG
jgi:long-subunit acyl-CoA synthetase (AMP-forming)